MSAALLAGLALAGCGGSGGSTGSTHVATQTTRTATAPAQTTPTPPNFTTATATIPATVTGTSHSPHAHKAPPASQGPRIPATFTIGPGERIQPPAVNAPALIPVQVTIVSADGRSHTATVHTVPPRRLSVPAGGRAFVLLPGLRDGRYTIAVDGGRTALALIIGGQPGP